MPDLLSPSAVEGARHEEPVRVGAEEAPLAPVAAGSVRPLAPDDIPAVAALFQKSFRRSGGATPASLLRYLDELFLRHPSADPELFSRVHVAADGTVDGFIGVLPAQMQFRGRPVRAAIAGSLMVADPHRDPLAGARLLRAFLKGPQDLSFSETANPISQGMWERLGGFVAPAYSMEWVRMLRPAAAGLAAFAQAVPAVRLLRPLALGFDRLAAPMTARLFGRIDDTPSVGRGADADEAAFAAAAAELAAACVLGPNWDSATLRWLLVHAREKERHGPLFRRIVTNRGGRLLGCSLFYGRPGGIGWVLQILARPDSVGAVVDDLFAQAARQGFAALRGRSDPLVLDALLRRKCLMLHRASTVVHARDRELVEAVRAGDAMLNGLAGESWTRLIGGEFA